MKNELERLRKIADVAHVIRLDDKSFIEEICVREGVDFTPCRKSSCNEAYRDMAVTLYARLNTEATESVCKYQLRPNTDVIFNGIRVNDATLTNELGDALLSMGFPVKFFVKYDTELAR